MKKMCISFLPLVFILSILLSGCLDLNTTEKTTKQPFSADEIISGYDLAISRSNMHERIYYKLIDFDSGMETDFTLVYRRHSTELDRIDVVGSSAIEKLTDNSWKESYGFKYEIKEIDGVKRAVSYDYEGKEYKRFVIEDLDKVVNLLKDALDGKDERYIKRVLTIPED